MGKSDYRLFGECCNGQRTLTDGISYVEFHEMNVEDWRCFRARCKLCGFVRHIRPLKFEKQIIGVRA